MSPTEKPAETKKPEATKAQPQEPIVAILLPVGVKLLLEIPFSQYCPIAQAAVLQHRGGFPAHDCPVQENFSIAVLQREQQLKLDIVIIVFSTQLMDLP